MKLRKRLGCSLTALILLSVGIALVMKFYLRERNLLEHATKISDVRQWWTGLTGRKEKPYLWLSDHVLLAHGGYPDFQAPFTFDLQTGEKTRLTKLYQLVSQEIEWSPYRWDLSPNRQWLLWIYGWEPNIYAARLDGSQYQVCRLPKHFYLSEIRWEQDSQHWLALRHDQKKQGMGESIQGDVSTPHKYRPLPNTTGWWYYSPVAQFSGAPPADGRYVSNRWPKDRYIEVFPLPGTIVFDYATDEIGNRVAWIYVRSHPSAFAAWIKRLFPSYPAASPLMAELWISKPDGKAMRFLGALPFERLPSNSGGLKELETEAYGLDRPRFLRWLPDGKRISFVYKGALYIVSVD